MAKSFDELAARTMSKSAMRRAEARAQEMFREKIGRDRRRCYLPMGYDLSNASGTYVRFTGSGWDMALAVARRYGWVPAGIPRPASWNENNDGPWEDEYWVNAGQQVTAQDAAALTAALDRAVAAADFVQTVQRIRDELNEELANHHPQWRDDLKPASPEQAERFRSRLVEFANLTRQGPFVIE